MFYASKMFQTSWDSVTGGQKSKNCGMPENTISNDGSRLIRAAGFISQNVLLYTWFENGGTELWLWDDLQIMRRTSVFLCPVFKDLSLEMCWYRCVCHSLNESVSCQSLKVLCSPHILACGLRFDGCRKDVFLCQVLHTQFTVFFFFEQSMAIFPHQLFLATAWITTLCVCCLAQDQIQEKKFGQRHLLWWLRPLGPCLKEPLILTGVFSNFSCSCWHWMLIYQARR